MCRIVWWELFGNVWPGLSRRQNRMVLTSWCTAFDDSHRIYITNGGFSLILFIKLSKTAYSYPFLFNAYSYPVHPHLVANISTSEKVQFVCPEVKAHHQVYTEFFETFAETQIIYSCSSARHSHSFSIFFTLSHTLLRFW